MLAQSRSGSILAIWSKAYEDRDAEYSRYRALGTFKRMWQQVVMRHGYLTTSVDKQYP